MDAEIKIPSVEKLELSKGSVFIFSVFFGGGGGGAVGGKMNDEGGGGGERGLGLNQY